MNRPKFSNKINDFQKLGYYYIMKTSDLIIHKIELLSVNEKRMLWLEKHILDDIFPEELFLVEKASQQQDIGYYTHLCYECQEIGIKKEGLNFCEICERYACDDHSAYLERDKENYMYEKCFNCYDAYLTENGLY